MDPTTVLPNFLHLQWQNCISNSSLPHYCRLLLSAGPAMSCLLQDHFTFIFESAEVQGDFHHKSALLFPLLQAGNFCCCFISFLYLHVMPLGLHPVSPYESPSSECPLFVSLFSRKNVFFPLYVSLGSISFDSSMSGYVTFTTKEKS